MEGQLLLGLGNLSASWDYVVRCDILELFVVGV